MNSFLPSVQGPLAHQRHFNIKVGKGKGSLLGHFPACLLLTSMNSGCSQEVGSPCCPLLCPYKAHIAFQTSRRYFRHLNRGFWVLLFIGEGGPPEPGALWSSPEHPSPATLAASSSPSSSQYIPDGRSHEKTGRNLKYIFPSERRQGKNVTYCVIPTGALLGKGRSAEKVRRL